MATRTCQKCAGIGERKGAVCPACNGSGRTHVAPSTRVLARKSLRRPPGFTLQEWADILNRAASSPNFSPLFYAMDLRNPQSIAARLVAAGIGDVQGHYVIVRPEWAEEFRTRHAEAMRQQSGGQS